MVERMTNEDEEVAQEFEKIIQNIIQTEEKKQPWRRNLIFQNKELLIMHLKNNARVNFIMLYNILAPRTYSYYVNWVVLSLSRR